MAIRWGRLSACEAASLSSSAECAGPCAATQGVLGMSRHTGIQHMEAGWGGGGNRGLGGARGNNGVRSRGC